jgi:hypothetical protein
VFPSSRRRSSRRVAAGEGTPGSRVGRLVPVLPRGPTGRFGRKGAEVQGPARQKNAVEPDRAKSLRKAERGTGYWLQERRAVKQNHAVALRPCSGWAIAPRRAKGQSRWHRPGASCARWGSGAILTSRHAIDTLRPERSPGLGLEHVNDSHCGWHSSAGACGAATTGGHGSYESCRAHVGAGPSPADASPGAPGVRASRTRRGEWRPAGEPLLRWWLARRG